MKHTFMMCYSFYVEMMLIIMFIVENFVNHIAKINLQNPEIWQVYDQHICIQQYAATVTFFRDF
jgi:hypothetical protein